MDCTGISNKIFVYSGKQFDITVCDMFLENVLCAGFRSQILNDVLKQQMHLFLLTVSNVSFCEYNLSIHA